MSKEKGQDVALKNGGAVAAYNYGESAGDGFGNTSGSDLAIPFYNVLQSNSPIVEDGTVEGAKAGMFFNTVTSELVVGEEGLLFQPAHIDHKFVEWTPRAKGGGFVAQHEIDSDVVKQAIANADGEFGKLNWEGNDLVDTYYVYGNVLSADGESVVGFGVVAFTSTKIKAFKNWLTSMRMIKGKPPVYAFRAIIKTFKDKNEKGTFYNVTVSAFKGTWAGCLIPPGNPLLDEATALRGMIASGAARADFNHQQAAGSADAEKPPF